jgi:hypothetical protein
MRVLFGLVVTFFIGVSLAWPAARTAQRLSTYTDGEYGFSINAPRFPESGTAATVNRLSLYAPAENGFACNVGVIIHRVAMSRQAYRDLSVRQFEQLGYTVNSEKNLTVSGKDAILFDYEGTVQGRELRFLGLAVMDTDRVFLVTATAPKASFKKYEPGFRTAIESFRLRR